MAGATIQLTTKKQHSLSEIQAKLNHVEGAEPISKTEQTINNVAIWTLVYEKYYIRTSSYTSISIVLTEHEQEQTACVVSAGGGSGVFNHSLGANRKFAKECVEVLESCGFSVIKSDLDGSGMGFAERFFT